MAAFASRLAADWLASGSADSWRELEGSAILADLSGFTRLTEALSARGPEGTEVLHRALQLSFSALLGSSVDQGGDIIGFAGDSAFVWFEGDDHQRRAMAAAASMPPALARLPAAVTGGRRLRVSIGVHSGPVLAVLAGQSQRGLFLCGPVVSSLVGLQSTASAGQIVISRSLSALVPAALTGSPIGEGFEFTSRRGPPDRRLHRLEPPDAGPSGSPPGSQHPMWAMVAPSVCDLLLGGTVAGDHRHASVGFIAVPGVESLLARSGPQAVHEALEHVVATVCRIADELSIVWLDTDVGASSVKLLVAAGVPQAIEHDEARLLLALRRILDECDVPLRAGAQRGRLFAGPLGVPTRMIYTVLGDAANVAARALGLAADRQLVVGDGLGVGSSEFVTATPLGPVALKNRLQPADLWRVESVQQASAASRSQHADSIRSIRDAEWRTMLNLWKHTVDTAGGTVLALVGEPGMGASELLGELTEFAGPNAANSMIVDHLIARQPYAAIAAIAAELGETAGSGRHDSGWAWLASFVPSLDDDVRPWAAEAIDVARGRSPLPGGDPQTVARRTRRVIAELLLAGAPRPWLLIVDGIDRLDEASRSVVGEMATMVSGRPFMLGVSCTESTGFDMAESSIVLELAPMDAAAAQALALDLDPTLRDDEITRLLAASRGNPFVLAELAVHRRQGDLPDSLHRLGAELIDALPTLERNLIREAACFGSTVSLPVIAAVLGNPDLLAPAAWTRASRVVRQVDADHIQFRQDAYREAAHRALPFQRRRAIHSAIADHLAHETDDADGRGYALAFHLEQAGRAREAFPLACAAGRLARGSGALAEASDLLGRAVKLARLVDRSALGGLMIEHGQVLKWIGELSSARRELSRAARVIDDPLVYAQMCHVRADLEIVAGRYRQSRQWVATGLAVADPFLDEATEVRARLLLDDAAVFIFTGRSSGALLLAHEALAAAVRIEDRALEGASHTHLEMAYSDVSDPRAVIHGDAAIAIYEELGHDRPLVDVLVNSGLTALLRGQWGEALRRYQRAVDVSDRIGNATAAASSKMNIGFVLFRQGKFDEATRLQRLATRTLDSFGLRHGAATSRYLASKLATARGEFGEAEKSIAEARSMFHSVGDHPMVIDCDVALVEHLVAVRRLNEALALRARINASLAQAEPSVFSAAERSACLATALDGDPRSGVEGLISLRDQAHLSDRIYDEYLCIVALLTIERECGVAVPGDLQSALDVIADRLGIVEQPVLYGVVPIDRLPPVSSAVHQGLE